MTDQPTDPTSTAEERPADIEVDARGMACPLPVIELAKAIRDAPLGGLVRLAATDEAASVDVPVWCRMQRQRLVARTTADDGALLFDVEKVREPETGPSVQER